MNCNTLRHPNAARVLRKSGCGVFVWAGLLAGFSPSVKAQTQAPGQAEVQPAQNPLSKTETVQPTSEVGPVVPTAPASMALAPKKAGVTRIGVVQPKVQFGQPSSNLTMVNPVRNLIIQYLNGPRFELIPIVAMLPAQVDEEAKQKDCDYVMFSSLIQRTNSGGLGMLRKAMPLASMIPGVGAVAGIGGAIAASSAASAAIGAADLKGLVKAKAEVTFEYQLMAPGVEQPVVAKAAKAKAKNDGDDIITPLVTQADAAIVAALTQKR